MSQFTLELLQHFFQFSLVIESTIEEIKSELNSFSFLAP